MFLQHGRRVRHFRRTRDVLKRGQRAMSENIRVLVVGLGTMGLSHARAYRRLEGFELAGLCTRRMGERADIATEFPGAQRFADFAEGLRVVKPDAVAICTYTETHAELALRALAAGAHVFCEKPLAEAIESATQVLADDRKLGLQCVDLLEQSTAQINPSLASPEKSQAFKAALRQKVALLDSTN